MISFEVSKEVNTIGKHEIEDFLNPEAGHGFDEHGEIISDGDKRVIILKYGSANNMVEIYEKEWSDTPKRESIWVRKVKIPQKYFESFVEDLPEKNFTPKDSEKWK